MAILPEKSSLTPDKAISRLFYFRDQIHFNHLQTKSFAEHKALDKLYNGVADFQDSISELLLGYIVPQRVVKMETYPIRKDLPNKQLLDELCKFADELYEYGEQTKWWALSNQAADLGGLGYKVKYLLTLE